MTDSILHQPATISLDPAVKSTQTRDEHALLLRLRKVAGEHVPDEMAAHRRFGRQRDEVVTRRHLQRAHHEGLEMATEPAEIERAHVDSRTHLADDRQPNDAIHRQQRRVRLLAYLIRMTRTVYAHLNVMPRALEHRMNLAGDGSVFGDAHQNRAALTVLAES